MTSKERLLGAIHGEPIDRVPISTYELVPCNPFARENHDPSYKRFMDHAREHTDCMVMWNPPRLPSGQNDREAETWREGASTFTRTTLHTPSGDLTQLQRWDEGVFTVWTLEPFIKCLDDIGRYLSVPYDFTGHDYSQQEALRKATGEHGIIMPSLVDPAAGIGLLMDPGEFLVLMVTEPRAMERYVNMMMERIMLELGDLLEHNAGDIYRLCGPELATPPCLSPEAFRKWMTPYCKRMIDLIQESGAIGRIHCHGKIGEVLDDILAIGCLALDPVEAPPSGDIMLADVKRAIGDRVCLMGNLQPRDMEMCSADHVEKVVRGTMRAGKPGGRFVIMPTSGPIQTPLPPQAEENYLRFIDVALEEGRY